MDVATELTPIVLGNDDAELLIEDAFDDIEDAAESRVVAVDDVLDGGGPVSAAACLVAAFRSSFAFRLQSASKCPTLPQ